MLVQLRCYKIPKIKNSLDFTFEECGTSLQFGTNESRNGLIYNTEKRAKKSEFLTRNFSRVSSTSSKCFL